jgi:hypothetical protein
MIEWLMWFALIRCLRVRARFSGVSSMSMDSMGCRSSLRTDPWLPERRFEKKLDRKENMVFAARGEGAVEKKWHQQGKEQWKRKASAREGAVEKKRHQQGSRVMPCHPSFINPAVQSHGMDFMYTDIYYLGMHSMGSESILLSCTCKVLWD